MVRISVTIGLVQHYKSVCGYLQMIVRIYVALGNPIIPCIVLAMVVYVGCVEENNVPIVFGLGGQLGYVSRRLCPLCAMSLVANDKVNQDIFAGNRRVSHPSVSVQLSSLSEGYKGSL